MAPLAQPEILSRNPPTKRDETLPRALLLFIGKCMERIVQLITKEIKVVEFHSSHPKFFHSGIIF